MNVRPGSEKGASLIEVMIAICVIGVGLLGLATAFSAGAIIVATSQPRFIAKEKAAEAIESVFAARDTRIISWDQLRNVANGGVFLDGSQSLREAGADGLVSTADDGAVQTIITPGPDGLMGTADDVSAPLNNYTREITITDLAANLRQLRVTVTFRVGQLQQQYILLCYISNYV
jgi:hypothetical protein